MNLAERVALTQATLDYWRDKPFVWGKTDCSRLVARHLKAFGHPVKLAQWGGYTTATSARAALKRQGHESLIAAVDSVASLSRITPLEALPGDVLAVPGTDAFSCLAIYLGNGRALGWHEDAPGCTILGDITVFDGAWRV